MTEKKIGERPQESLDYPEKRKIKTALVFGAGGFLGSHLVKRLKAEGYWVRAVDIKYPEFSPSLADEFLLYDLCEDKNVQAVMRLDYVGRDSTTPLLFQYNVTAYCVRKPFDEVYQLAAEMGGAGYVFTGENDSYIMHRSATINLNVARWATEYGCGALFYSSSACIYPKEVQSVKHILSTPRTIANSKRAFMLRESDAYPANPDSEYGWEKLFSERLYQAYHRNHGLNIRIARFHNIYGPEGTYKGGKEKAPAAMCRKVIEEHIKYSSGDERMCIEIWGDGTQTRSFLYIDDCIEAVRLLMESGYTEPVNIGSEHMVTINELANIAIRLGSGPITKKYIDGPTGVAGRNSDNTILRSVIQWEPGISLEDGMAETFRFIKLQMVYNG